MPENGSRNGWQEWLLLLPLSRGREGRGCSVRSDVRGWDDDDGAEDGWGEMRIKCTGDFGERREGGCGATGSVVGAGMPGVVVCV